MSFLKRSHKLCDRFVNLVKERPDDSGSSSWVLISCLSTPGWPACIYQQFRQQQKIAGKLQRGLMVPEHSKWRNQTQQRCSQMLTVGMETALPQR